MPGVTIGTSSWASPSGSGIFGRPVWSFIDSALVFQMTLHFETLIGCLKVVAKSATILAAASRLWRFDQQIDMSSA